MQALKLLIHYGGSISVPSTDGFTPICYAAEEGHITVVNDLVAHGASVSTRSKHGCTPLFHAAKGGSLDVLKRLLLMVSQRR